MPFDGDSRGTDSSRAPGLLVPSARTKKEVVGKTGLIRDRRYVNVGVAVVGDNGLGLPKGHEGADGEKGAAVHS